MSRLQGRIDRLEQRERAIARPDQHDDRPTLEDCFNALTDAQEREDFIALVRDVHAIQQREHEAQQAGQAIPPRSVAEQARLDDLDHCIERQKGETVNARHAGTARPVRAAGADACCNGGRQS